VSTARSSSSISPIFARLLLALICLAGRPAAAAPYYLQALELPPNAENPGFTSHPSGVNSFCYNPSLSDPSDLALALSYDSYLGGFNGFSFGGQYAVAGKGTAGLTAFLFKSEPFDDFILNEYFDPVKTGTVSPASFNVALSWIPVFGEAGGFPGNLKTGFAVRFVHEYLVDRSLNALSFDAGLNGRLPWMLRYGFSLRNIGFGFFRMNQGYLPLEAACGIYRTFRPGGKEFYLDILLNNRYVLDNRDEWLFGGHPRLVLGRAVLEILVDLRLSIPRNGLDGFSFGFTLGTLPGPRPLPGGGSSAGKGPGTGIKVVYRIALPSGGGSFHNLSLVYLGL